MRRIAYSFVGAVAFGVLVACEPISEPWMSGKKAERLEDQATRTDEQKQALRDRLNTYGGAYQ